MFNNSPANQMQKQWTWGDTERHCIVHFGCSQALVLCYVPEITMLLMINLRKTHFVFIDEITILNSTLNPFLYFWRIREVRHAVKQTIGNVLCSPWSQIFPWAGVTVNHDSRELIVCRIKLQVQVLEQLTTLPLEYEGTALVLFAFQFTL